MINAAEREATTNSKCLRTGPGDCDEALSLLIDDESDVLLSKFLRAMAMALLPGADIRVVAPASQTLKMSRPSICARIIIIGEWRRMIRSY